MQKIAVISCGSSPRLTAVLAEALQGVAYEEMKAAQLSKGSCRNRRILFAVAVDAWGMDEEFCGLLRRIRSAPDCLAGAVGAVIMDGATELDTKHMARLLILAANGAGCLFPGKPLVEATGSLGNLDILAKKNGLPSLEAAYRFAARTLVQRLVNFVQEKKERPRILLLHASDHKTSNTLALGEVVAGRLAPYCEFRTVSLRNGTVHDCRGCSYKVCAHFAQSNSCFYGGTIVEDVFPAVLESDALLLLCPNYNDAVGANIMAFINRLTSLMVSNSLVGKSLYSIVVSGYSGGDLVAQQLLGALCLNKSLTLPPDFCLMETANDPGAALHAKGNAERTAAFADRILAHLRGTKNE